MKKRKTDDWEEYRDMLLHELAQKGKQTDKLAHALDELIKSLPLFLKVSLSGKFIRALDRAKLVLQTYDLTRK